MRQLLLRIRNGIDSRAKAPLRVATGNRKGGLRHDAPPRSILFGSIGINSPFRNLAQLFELRSYYLYTAAMTTLRQAILAYVVQRYLREL